MSITIPTQKSQLIISKRNEREEKKWKNRTERKWCERANHRTEERRKTQIYWNTQNCRRGKK